jgi:hypothetical protein
VNQCRRTETCCEPAVQPKIASCSGAQAQSLCQSGKLFETHCARKLGRGRGPATDSPRHAPPTLEHRPPRPDCGMPNQGGCWQLLQPQHPLMALSGAAIEPELFAGVVCAGVLPNVLPPLPKSTRVFGPYVCNLAASDSSAAAWLCFCRNKDPPDLHQNRGTPTWAPQPLSNT